MSESTKPITPQPITEEMTKSYLDYAMSVIVARALPDVRDGLKPVHRRILYAMHRLGLNHSSKFRKSATVVGEVLGKYHPHGDVSVYEAMVRMAQEFSLRYPMVRGQGNFGSMDGDAPAAMRYTEAKMQKITTEMLFDIDKNSVDWADNYDASRKEPKVLPSKLPQLLLNGSLGIAVGMATNIPPHNLEELVDGLFAMIKNPEISSGELMEIIQGPDFPTGANIYGRKDIIEAYSRGKGAIPMRATTKINEMKNGGFQIIVTEVPYQVNKADMLTKIADLVKNKKLQGIRALRDESDKDGVRVVIEIKKSFQPKKILNFLYKHTDLEKNFHLNMLALVDGIEPRLLNIRECLHYYLEHRQVVVKRRSEFELKKAEERMHILEGFKKALDQIDAIITTIRESKNRSDAHKNLIKKYKFSDEQTTAILDMQLASLAGMERKKVLDELEEKKKLIDYLKSLLADPKKILGVVKDELLEVKKVYGDDRRTKVFVQGLREMGDEDMVNEEEVIVTLTRQGYVKRLPITSYKTQARGGTGILGLVPKEEDIVEQFFTVSTIEKILFFTEQGRVFQLYAYEIPEGTRTSKGRPIAGILEVDNNDHVSAALVIRKDTPNQYKYIVLATRNGIIKKTSLDQFQNIRKSGLIAMNIKADDALLWADFSTSKDEVFIVTEQGKSIRFKEKDVNPQGRSAGGVKAIKLQKEDRVCTMDIVKPTSKESVLIISEKGLGKRTKITGFRLQTRAGSGIKAGTITPKTGRLIKAVVLGQEHKSVLAISKKGKVIKTELKKISKLGRTAQGVRIMKLGSTEDRVATFVTF